MAEIVPGRWIEGTVEFKQTEPGEYEPIEVHHQFYAKAGVVYTIEAEIRLLPSRNYRHNIDQFGHPVVQFYFIRNGWGHDAIQGFAWPNAGLKQIDVTARDKKRTFPRHYRFRLSEHEVNDYPGTMDHAATISIGESVFGSTPRSDVDWFAFEATTPGIYGVILTKHRTAEFSVDLFDISGIEVPELAAGWWEVSEPTKYWMRVTGGWDFPFAYMLTVAYAGPSDDDHGNDPSAATVVYPNTTPPRPHDDIDIYWDKEIIRRIDKTVAILEGTVQHFLDDDWFAIHLQKGTKYRIIPMTRQGSSSDDRLGQNMTFELLSNDLRIAGEEDLHPTVGFVPSETGTYHLKMSNNLWGSLDPEDYRIEIYALPPDDIADILEAAAVVTDGDVLTGILNTRDDLDWFRFNGSTGQVWSLESGAPYWGCIAIFDRDPAERLAERCGQSRFAWTVPRNGQYGIMFSSAWHQKLYEDGNGEYSFTLKLLDQDDHDSVEAQATTLSDRVTHYGSINYEDDIDLFVLPVRTDEIWELSMEHKNYLIGYVIEFVPAGSTAPHKAVVDEWLSDYLEHRRVLKAPESGRWLIRMAEQDSIDKFSSTTYELTAHRLHVSDDFGDDWTTAYVLPSPTRASEPCHEDEQKEICQDTISVAGRLDHYADIDVFKIGLDSENTYQFRVTSPDNRAQFNLLQANRCEPHDESFWSWRRHPWRPMVSGDYWIYVSDADYVDEPLRYELEVTAIADDVSLPLDSAIVLKTGVIHSVGEEGDEGRSLYRVKLDHSEYVLEIQGAYDVEVYSPETRYDRSTLVGDWWLEGEGWPAFGSTLEPLNQYVSSDTGGEIFFRVTGGQVSEYSVLVREYVPTDLEYNRLQILGTPILDPRAASKSIC